MKYNSSEVCYEVNFYRFARSIYYTHDTQWSLQLNQSV